MWRAIGVLLALPAVAMRFTSEIAWTGTDFAAAAILLVGSGLAFELLCRWTNDRRYRAVFGMAILMTTAAIWAEGAVGIF